jgi:hypothetical protein
MALARWQATIVDEDGNILPGASVEVREEISGLPLAVLYSDRAGVVSIGNPFVADAEGFAAFHAIGGAYKITATSGAFSRIWRYVAVGTAAESDEGAFTLSEFVATGTTSLRTAADHAGDLFSLKDFGAVGDGGSPLTDDTAAVTAADASTARKFVPSGIYDVTLTASDLDGPYWGSGQIRDSSDNLRGPWFSAIKAAPSSFGNHDAVTTAFNGDLSKVQIAMEHRITGSATLGNPTTGYQADPETSAIYLNVFNSSGHNEETGGNDGRTAAVPFRLQMANAGQGDMLGFYINGVVVGGRAGATHFLANPAISMFAGAMFAGNAGVFLNPAETQMHDEGFDVAGLGWNMVMNRTVQTGALSAFWGGFRTASIGSAYPDSAYSAAGKHNVGLDFSMLQTNTTKVAIALVANDRIYGNTASSLGLKATSLGDEWIEFNSGINAWSFVVDNVSVLQVYTNQVLSTKPLKFTGSSSGTATITAQAAAGTPTLTLPTGSGTFAVSATAPIVLDAATGGLTLNGNVTGWGNTTRTVNFNSANSDTQIPIVLPAGFTRYRISSVVISHASQTLTTATFGLFTAAGGAGTALIAGGTAITVSTASENTNNNMQTNAAINTNTESFNASSVFFRVGTAQGAAATADVTISYTPVS